MHAVGGPLAPGAHDREEVAHDRERVSPVVLRPAREVWSRRGAVGLAVHGPGNICQRAPAPERGAWW